MAGADLTEQQRTELTELLSSPLEYPPEFKDWVPQFLAQTIPYLPLAQIAGVGTVEPWFGVINTPSSQSGNEENVWGDLSLSPTGPRVDGVSGGDYLAIWGHDFEAGNEASGIRSGVSIDGDDPLVYIDWNPGIDEGYFNWKAAMITVPSDGELHFVKLKYMFSRFGSNGTCTVNYRWLILIRVK